MAKSKTFNVTPTRTRPTKKTHMNSTTATTRQKSPSKKGVKPPSKLSPPKMEKDSSVPHSSIPTRKSPRLQKDSSPSSIDSGENWAEFYNTYLKSSKRDDFTLLYFMTGDNITQDDRSHVAQAMEFYCTRTKRDNSPPAAIVTAGLSADIVGVTTNRNTNHPVKQLFKTAKQLNAMYFYLQETRANFNNIVVHISVDGSPYFQVL